MSGENQGAYDAATQEVDQAYEEQIRQLDSMYKSLRPGTDLASDSAYRRDRQALDDQYAQRKALVSAQVQQGAVGSAMQSGQNQMQNMALALQPQFDQQSQQWVADYAKRAQLRNQLMGIGASYAYPQNGNGALSQLFGNRYGNTNPTY
jgi:small-conductance mechanosensitive channel